MEREDYRRNKTKNTQATFNNITSARVNIRQGEISDAFYETLQNILNKVNKNGYIILRGDMNARIGNSKITNTVDTYVEAALHSNDKILIGFGIFNNG